MSEQEATGAIPILRAKTGRRYNGPPTVRYNPRTRVATLSITAWRSLGEPDSVGLWLARTGTSIYFVGNPADPDVARKLSKKRTFVITALRDLVPEEGGPKKWLLEPWDETYNTGFIQLDSPIEENRERE